VPRGIARHTLARHGAVLFGGVLSGARKLKNFFAITLCGVMFCAVTRCVAMFVSERLEIYLGPLAYFV